MDERSIKTETIIYWKEISRTDFDKYITHILPNNYINSLLEKEINWAKSRGALPKAKCSYLAMLVGFSFEPLLQTVKVYSPENVFLILNSEYGKDITGDYMGIQLKKMLEKNMGIRNVSYFIMDSSSPAAVFKALLEYMKKETEEPKKSISSVEQNEEAGCRVWPLVLDITGGKKSMVSGAFLFGAYADIPISYVDFDEYDRSYGRPYGYTCRIDFLDNPYSLFQLNDWRKVKDLYTHYSFHACRKLLENVRRSMDIDTGSPAAPYSDSKEAFFDEDQLAAVEKMEKVLHMYELWENGDYKGALSCYHDLFASDSKIKAPFAVTALGARWPSGGLGGCSATGCECDEGIADWVLKELESLEYGNGKESLYSRVDLLAVYARDELCKIERLIKYNEDSRSALLRAAGLNEFLLKARAIAMFLLGCMDVKDKNGTEVDNLDEGGVKDTIVDFMLDRGYRGTFLAVLGDECKIPNKNPLFRVKLKEAHRFSKSWMKLRDGFIKEEDLAKLRNKTTHTCLPIAKELAEQARALACAHFDSFYEWASKLDCNGCEFPALPDNEFEEMEWEELCKLCKVDFLPPENMGAGE